WRATVRRQPGSSNESDPFDHEQIIQAAWKNFGTKSTDSIDIVSQAADLQSFLQSPKIKSSAQGPPLYFLYNHDASTTLGIYAGSGVPISPLFEEFNNVVKSREYPGEVLVQACGPSSPAVGIVAASGSGSLREAQRALHRRADCTTVAVKSGDLCADLASRCGIPVKDLLKFNPQPDFCTSLKDPQLVCCSQGDLPVPKPDSDGNCATYKIDSGDSCWGITKKYSGLITTDELEKYNKRTWGWGGCENLQLKTRICVSSGNPPLPEPVQGAACGPVKPGTTRPPSGTELASLNPCPLNSCCSVYGFCGTTEDFCRPILEGEAPGAPQPPGGANCISNCGMDIVNNKEPPKEFVKVGYFEGYGISRPCNRVGIRTIDISKYTHIHFAFATVTRDSYQVVMGPTINQFTEFKKITGTKKILSFGGWAFSTEPATYQIFRDGVRSEKRNLLAQNIAKFIQDNDLDGVDIDWEYPAAPDLPDIPKGDAAEGNDYLKFLTRLRELLPKDKYSVSFAAPASFWYLQGFPVKKIMEVVDYVIYMTYDLHGQWDYGNKWATPGCLTGNCLRSHVNMTETMNALAMITKAGAPSNKVVVGVTSYGRSFKMTESGCTGEMCNFVGPDSGAAKGQCTGTAGYISNAEIREIIATNPSAEVFTDDSESDILVYNDTGWPT
ncbi:hypothetical protein DHEL01_v211790, partial [Diaporthe helianthi]